MNFALGGWWLQLQVALGRVSSQCFWLPAPPPLTLSHPGAGTRGWLQRGWAQRSLGTDPPAGSPAQAPFCGGGRAAPGGHAQGPETSKHSGEGPAARAASGFENRVWDGK